MKCIYLTLALLFMCMLSGHAQFNFTPVELPSSNVWNLMKYNNAAANLYTGTASVNIPAYTYKDNDITIPVSFNYASNGLTVNRPSGIVGWDWSMIAGGSITREVRGIPDEESMNIYGFKWLREISGFNELSFKPGNFMFVDDLQGGGLFRKIAYYPNGLNKSPRVECESDLFHFNFMGYSGSFMYGYEGKIHVVNTNTRNGEFAVNLNNFPLEIVITTGDGYKYSFGGDYACEFVSSINNFDQVNSPTTTWNLTKIETPYGRRATFGYKYNPSRKDGTLISGTQTRYSPQSSYFKSMIIIDAASNTDERTEYTSKIAYSTITASYLSSITIDNGCKINFYYSSLTSRETQKTGISQATALPGDYNIKLSEINVLDASHNVVKTVTLDYSHATNGNPLTFLKSVNISGEGRYDMEYYKRTTETFPHNGTFHMDHWGYYNGIQHTEPHKFIYNCSLNPDNTENIPSGTRDPNHNYAVMGMLQEINYPAGGKSVFTYEPHDYRDEVRRTNTDKEPQFGPNTQDKTTGGMRIKKITGMQSDNTVVEEKEYRYKNYFGYSSGILLYFPRYLVSYDIFDVVGLYERTSMASMYDVYRYGPHIEYSEVQEVNRDNSKTIYKYSSSLVCPNESQDGFTHLVPNNYAIKIPGQTDYIAYDNGIANLLTPERSLSGDRGKLIGLEHYNAAGALLRSEVHGYNRDIALRKQMNYVDLRFALRPYYTYVENYPLEYSTVNEYRQNGTLNSTVYYTYNTYGQIASEVHTDSNEDRYTTNYQYVGDIGAGQRTGVQNKMIEQNLVNQPILTERFVKKAGESANRKISSERFLYQLIDNKAYPHKWEVCDISNNTWKTQMSYDLFNSKGNIRQITDGRGMPTTYLWGYNGTVLFAEIRNATFDQVQIAAASSGLNLQYLLTNDGHYAQTFDNLRKNLSNAHITTFNYKHLVGLYTLATTTGHLTYCGYDGSGRLQEIYFYENNRKRITAHYKYNLKNQ